MAYQLNPFQAVATTDWDQLLCSTVTPGGPVPLFRFVSQPLPEAFLPDYGGPYLFGYKFTVDANCTIDEIGIYNSSPTNNSLGIWSVIDGIYTLLFQDVIESTGPRSDGGFNWLLASSFSGLPSIVSGVSYVIAMAWEGIVPSQMDVEDLLFETSVPALGRIVEENAYSTELLSSLDANLTSYTPNETNLADGKSFFTANLILRPVP
jgi:hypothetical protein